MEVKGITWVGNIYQKFENMCLEVEDMMFEDTVKYMENQVLTVGASVKKLYSDVTRDLLPPSSCDLDEKITSEWPIDQYIDAGFCKESFQGSKERTVKTDTMQTAKDSRINCDVDNDVIHAASHDGSCETDALFTSASGNSIKGNNFNSHARQCVGITDIKSNIGIDENRQNEKMTLAKTFGEIIFPETVKCRTSQSCELSNENEYYAVTVSKPTSAEVTRLASVADCCNEIENISTEQIPNVLVLIKSAEEKEMNTSSSSSGFLFRGPDGFSMDRTIQSDDCYYSTVFVSHPEAWSLDAAEINTVTEQGHRTMREDDELKLEQTCVMVTRDELRFPKAEGNLKTKKKKMRQAFSLSKKSARKQEYEELAVWHGNDEQGKGNCVVNLSPTLVEDQKKLLLPNTSELDWELL